MWPVRSPHHPQHGGVRSALLKSGHHGQWEAGVPGVTTALEGKVWCCCFCCCLPLFSFVDIGTTYFLTNNADLAVDIA